jgi:hypothetical protein
MSEEEKGELLAAMQRGDRYGLMLLAVRQWLGEYHPRVIRAAVYAIESDDAEPTRVRIPLSSGAAG